MFIDVIWRHCSWSALVQVRACCLTTSNHNLNQCWRILNYTPKNISEWNHTLNSNIFFKKTLLKMSSAKCRSFCRDPGICILLDKCHHKSQAIWNAFSWKKKNLHFFTFWKKNVHDRWDLINNFFLFANSAFFRTETLLTLGMSASAGDNETAMMHVKYAATQRF